ncbi:CBS domain-containing protein [Amycolatopsis benzoatilytica]|uniref:CBS domain-containing protein n=1 Tax=Amycolatopsis benzoatilytica TaxID=346045 RepID=UPI00039F205F|nr:CBS domain-containing protein [Amycolatopsis benzoatilytica]
MCDQRVADVMARQVVSARHDTSFRDLLAALLEHGAPAVPVVDPAGRPIGLVTAADVTAKSEFHGGADRVPTLGRPRRRSRWRKAGARTAAELMTAPAPTIAADAPLHAALRRLADARSDQLCVVDREARLVGLMSHRDVLSAFLRSDADIQAEAEAGAPAGIGVRVAEGVVTLTGTVGLRSVVEQAVRAAQRVRGVVAVCDELDFRFDDVTAHGM